MNLIGIHDREGQTFTSLDTWILDTIALSENPEPTSYKPGFGWITRVNWGYGSTGTIPGSDGHDTLFLERLVRYVTSSKNCTRWIIGNEPNLSREWPNGQPIYPSRYAAFYLRCQDVLRNALKENASKHEILIAAPGPWNNEIKYSGNLEGDWIQYFSDVISYCEKYESVKIESNSMIGGFSIHAYTHGYDPKLVTSDAKMDAPFQDRHYEFRTYLDFVNAIPDRYAHKSIYLTEANGNGPWQATGLMPAMADEIMLYNNRVRNRKIKSLIFYRWPKYDDFFIEGKQDVMGEYKNTVARNIVSPEGVQTNTPVVTNPTVPGVIKIPSGTPTATVKASILNVRNRPGTTNSQVVDKKYAGDKISILDQQTVDGSTWYKIGLDQWVIADWTERADQPPKDKWQRSREFTAGWEGEYQNLNWDIGNWTGCEVGKGTNKGTKYGISACAYPHLDIKNLTREQADKIYYENYWLEVGADQLDWPMCAIVFDTAINFGTTNAQIWRKESKDNPFIYLALRLRGYRRSKAWPQAGNAWVDRTIDLLLEAGE